MGKTVIKHAMGIACALIILWGCGFIYTAIAAPYALWWDQGVVGVACLIGALLIYRRWFRRMKDSFMEKPQDDAVISNLVKHVAAIRLCLDNHLRMPALALIYCGIDVLASLSRPAENAEVKPSDFINFAEKYMDCSRLLGVSGLDLYAARCGILHTYTMDSRLSAKGEARRIIYAWGNQETDQPMELLRSLNLPEVMIKIETLFSTFLHGVEAFGRALGDDPTLESLVRTRGRKLFMDRASFPSRD
jgi:hypothetical protein